MKAHVTRAARWLLAGAGLALTMTGVADARNRTTEMMVSDIARDAGVSHDTAFNRSQAIVDADIEILPGVFQSIGGVLYSHAGSNRALAGLRFYNESSVTICIRANAAVTSGVLVGSRQGGNVGFNFLIEPGSSEFFLVNTTTNVRSGGDLAGYASRYYMWVAGPASMEKRCSPASIAPPDLESWISGPLQDGQLQVNYTPELARQLGM